MAICRNSEETQVVLLHGHHDGLCKSQQKICVGDHTLPLGSKEQSRDSCWMTIDFEKGERGGHVTVFPTETEYAEYIQFVKKIDSNPSNFNPLSGGAYVSPQQSLSQSESILLKDILNRDPLAGKDNDNLFLVSFLA